jgi:hypothetical protein
VSGRQRGYNLVGLAEVGPVCDLLEAEGPDSWPLAADLRAAMARAECKRLPATAFKFPVGDRADVLGRALTAVRRPSPHRGVNRAKVPLG